MMKEAHDLQLEFPQLKGAISKAAPKMMVKKRWLDYAEAQALEEKQRESKFEIFMRLFIYCLEQMEAMKAQEQAYHQQMQQPRQQPFHQASRASPALSAISSNSRGSPRTQKGQPNRPAPSQGHFDQNYRPKNFGQQEMTHERNMMPGQNAPQNYGYNPWAQGHQQMAGQPQSGQRTFPHQNPYYQHHRGPHQQLSWQQGNYAPQNGAQMNRLPYMNQVSRLKLSSFFNFKGPTQLNQSAFPRPDFAGQHPAQGFSPESGNRRQSSFMSSFQVVLNLNFRFYRFLFLARSNAC